MPRKKYYKKPAKQQQIAKKRIRFLFNEAKESFKKDKRLSDKNVKLARRIAMKYKIRLPSSLKKKFCKNCYQYLVPGVNCRVRIHRHKIIYYCFSCKHYIRHPVR
ncbi:ribonuclease P [Candidatus Woesearchaeota archaeon]|jgi:ribonuclease P protein subunit RPR2|nr:ribonuclease P [Candidatus Woesearchaeota archaeon]MDP6648014.1 ribonuclease P [Candidatus Woesearchaeota archaeon]|tara:strand:- start:51067 stop:51381 length:315 start_codon:yes stop_codon:yes gene_type:complete